MHRDEKLIRDVQQMLTENAPWPIQWDSDNRKFSRASIGRDGLFDGEAASMVQAILKDKRPQIFWSAAGTGSYNGQKVAMFAAWGATMAVCQDGQWQLNDHGASSPATSHETITHGTGLQSFKLALRAFRPRWE